MLTIKNVKGLDLEIRDHQVAGEDDTVFDAEGRLLLLPALIDTHVHVRDFEQKDKEDWESMARACIAGGVTTIFDMPNNQPPCTTEAALERKISEIESTLKRIAIPLHYRLYFGADKDHLDELGHVKDRIIGLKIYMGQSTGGLVMDEKPFIEKAFQLAAQENVMIAVHAEDEEIMCNNKARFATEKNPAVHSKIRDRQAAIKATAFALECAEKYNCQLNICHVSTKEEIALIRDAKKNELLVYCEVTPHHLFFDEHDYDKWGTLIQVNPPVRTKDDHQALWEAINDGTVDFIATDHAPHLLDEKKKEYGQAPSGIPSIELMLPLMLDACSQGKMTLDRLVTLTRINQEQIFNLERNEDVVLVDLELEKKVSNQQLKTKCGWSPYEGRILKGWPVYTILNGKMYPCQ